MSENIKMVILTENQLKEIVREAVAEALKVSSSEDRCINAEEAAGLLGVSPGWLYKNSRKLPFTVKLHSKMLRFSHTGIQRYIAAKTVKPGT